uniref:Peptidase S1 domain-containing protein n=1 Tax=Stomoxys calcitrans TaxID=35570 RepID=A0A1I8NTN9_STOCA
MLSFLVVIVLINSAFAVFSPNDFSGRIVNGVNTTIQKHPHQVSLQTTDGRHFCGGSIISEDIVVTASHCLMNLEGPHELKVRLGATEYNTGGELVSVKSFRMHENFDTELRTNDVGVVKLSSPVRESSRVRYIKLTEKTPPTGTRGTITGWGASCFLVCDLVTHLQEVEVEIIDYKTCASSEYNYGSEVRETMVCTYAVEKGSCQSDSGGPVVVAGKLVGLVSWGAGCAVPGFPSVHADVASARSWIEKVAKEL